MAYTVSQRSQEIGVRVALGASQRDVVRMVVVQGAWLAGAGVAIGLVGAAIAARAIQSLLFQTSGLDPLTFVVAPIVLGVAALLASYLPGAPRRLRRWSLWGGSLSATAKSGSRDGS